MEKLVVANGGGAVAVVKARQFMRPLERICRSLQHAFASAILEGISSTFICDEWRTPALLASYSSLSAMGKEKEKGNKKKVPWHGGLPNGEAS